MKRLAAVFTILATWLLTIGMVVQTTPAAAAQNDFHYKDNFNSGNYSGNNGADDFWGNWWEAFDWGGYRNGDVTVESGGDCPADRCARISGDPATFWGTGLMRNAETGDAESVTVKFQYRLDVHESTSGTLQVVVFGDGDLTVLDSIPLDDRSGDEVHTKVYDATGAADDDFALGFFAQGDWHAQVYIDNVEVYGEWDEPPPPTTTTTTTTTQPPTTTTTQPPTTTTTQPPPTTTRPPTTSTTAPPTPSTTFAPPTTTSTTAAPPTTAPPATTSTTFPPGVTVAPTPPTTTSRPPVQIPLVDDTRYTQKGELLRLAIAEDLMSLPAPEADRVAPGPVTQIMASVTTTAVTVRSHLLSAMALGLLIAIAAIWGLGKRQTSA